LIGALPQGYVQNAPRTAAYREAIFAGRLAETHVYNHIMIATDGSGLSEQAVEHGIALAKALGARVTALTVSEPFYPSAFGPKILEQYQKHVAALATQYLEVAKDAAAASDVVCDLMRVEHEQPYKAIIDTAERIGCDAIVMASHGRGGVAAFVLGSETVKVLTHSTIPVIVVRRQSPAAFVAAS
jgi:nucleotide-binding universal stress UspA family protein